MSHVITIGMEGPNRVGKGTQAALLQNWLIDRGVFALIVRGDGSRTGDGNSPGDPYSAWWQAVNEWLRGQNARSEDWHLTSLRLARELIVWRDRVLPQLVSQTGHPLAALIVDRTVLSRSMIFRSDDPQVDPAWVNAHLYPLPARGQRIMTPEKVCPDVIFNFSASRDVLLRRLDPADPKLAFRQRLIERAAAWYTDAVDYIPASLRFRVIAIDADRPPNVIFQEVLKHLELRGVFQTLEQAKRQAPNAAFR
jgi:thymidylate kinase